MTMLDTIHSATSGFMPHGMCYLWTPSLVWLHVLSDSFIALAYLVIPVTLLVVVRRRNDLPFDWMILLFGIFIVACGLTHVMAVWNVWNSDYWISGFIKAITAIASVPTAIVLIYQLPRILEIPNREELETANRRLAEANHELEQFAYAVSHDLRAPLRSVEGYGSALTSHLEGQLDDKGRHYLDRMRAGSRRMADLIDDMLELSRLSREHVTFRELDLGALASEVATTFKEMHPARNIEFEIQRDMKAVCDPGLMRIVLENLVGNAIKFSADRDPARIEIWEEKSEDGRTIFHVRDNGAGFDMRYANKLFTVFQRLHSMEQFEGNGLGLATVERIIHRHGGSIWANSVEGEGATFSFTLQ